MSLLYWVINMLCSINARIPSTFVILENYQCWRFHGSGAIVALQIIGLIFFCIGMHHDDFFEVVSVHSCSPIMFENTENIQLIDVHSVCFRGDFAIKTVVGFLR